MKKKSSKYLTLLLLAIVFAAPGVTAYVFYQHPRWLGSSTVNKGALLNPPLVLKFEDKHPKWRIVYWSPGACDALCLSQLDTLARVRLALGRKLYDVDQWLILGDQAPALDKETETSLKEHDFHLRQLTAKEMNDLATFSTQAKVFLANPDDYLILSYQSQVNPDDVYKDLKLLLNTTQNKSG